MLKKILGVLLIPAMVIGVFAGCGKKHTLSDVNKLYTHIVDKYSYEENGEKKSYFFNSVVATDENGQKEVPGVALEINYKGELGKYLPNNITNNIALKVSDPKLYNRYYALGYIEQKLLDWTFNYYENWAANLYASEELIEDVEQDDIENLYTKLENLDEAIGDFAAEKSKAEDEINAITFDGAINLTSFTYYFNDLIEASFDFVNAFRDVHVKYIWNTYTFGDNNEQNKLLLDRMIDEAYLNIAQIIYLENVKVFEYSECDLNALIEEIDSGGYSEDIISPLLTKISSLDNGKAALLDADAKMYESDDINLLKNYKYDAALDANVPETYNDRLEDYVYYLKAFNQKVGIYKKVYADFDMYEYNQVRLGLSTIDIDTYVNSLDRVEKANLVLLQDFARETFANYIETFSKIFY